MPRLHVGTLLRPLRHQASAAVAARFSAPAMTLTSAAFDDGAPLPVRYTADGAAMSPPLAWSALPPGTASLALLVEDVDVPFPQPLVHLLLHAIPPNLTGLAEAAIPQRHARSRLFSAGRNSAGRLGWLPPSPIPGHGPHRYIFQLFALAIPFAPRRIPGRSALRLALRHHILGQATLTGSYERQ